MYTLKQSDIVGTPFAVETEYGSEGWERWTDNAEGKRKKFIARFHDENGTRVFKKWDNDVRQWVEITFKKSDGWKRVFRRKIVLEQPIKVNVWDTDTKQRIDADVQESYVEFTGGVEEKLQIAMQSESKRGNDPLLVYYMLNKKSTGPLPMNVEYSVFFEKARDSNQSAPTQSEPVNAATPGPQQNAPGLLPEIQEIVGAILHQTQGTDASAMAMYKPQILKQINEYLESKGITTTTAEAVFENHILPKK